MSFTLRLAARPDEPAVQEVVRAVYEEYGFTWDPDDYHADLFDLEAHYFRHDFPFWVAEREGNVVGTAALQHHALIPGTLGGVIEVDGVVRVAASDCSLERVYVHPGARRMGIGRALSEQVATEARARGHRVMEIWSDKRFGAAHALYQAMGARIVGDRICDDPDLSPEWGLALDLAAYQA